MDWRHREGPPRVDVRNMLGGGGSSVPIRIPVSEFECYVGWADDVDNGEVDDDPDPDSNGGASLRSW